MLRFLLPCLLICPGALGQSDYDVIWDTPGADFSDSMPLGNGDIGLNAWVEPNGDLVFYIGKTDSWGDNGRLLKVGRVRVKLDPQRYVEGAPFAQRLRLEEGTMEVRFGAGEDAVTLQLWVDAHHPVIHITAESSEPITATATIEPWRIEAFELPSIEVSDVLLDRSDPDGWREPTVVEPDTILTGMDGRIGWYHHNAKSVGPELTAKIQGLSEFERADPLLHRTFGVIIGGPGAERLDDLRLRSRSGTSIRFDAIVKTEHPASPEEWRERVEETVADVEELPFDERRSAHVAWWKSFWQRSWIEIGSTEESSRPSFVPLNDHDVRVGFDQQGGNVFVGEIGRVSLYRRGLTAAEIKGLADTPRGERPGTSPDLCFSERDVSSGQFDSAEWTFERGFTVEAWLEPGDLPGGGGRIVDKVTPGGADGFLFDTYPGRSLRLITAEGILSARDVLPHDTWVHVAAVADPEAGALSIYLDGALVAHQSVETLDEAFVVSRAYALQRFIDACAGRGAYPIKFNGSIFTVPNPGSPGDADYRRWGPGYWWQNTRLPYLSMCASGDFEMMLPLFEMYAGEVLVLSTHRTKRYFGHGGAFLPECIYFWGDVFSESYGWTPFEERGEDKLQKSGYHKWEWVAGPELVWMMLEYFDHTRDESFLKEKLLPAAHQILTFFDQHYELDEKGKLHMYPAQAVETWWDCTNPMPEVAGLHAVTNRLLELPAKLTRESERAFWSSLRAKLPDLPTREVDGVSMLAPAERFEQKRNIENPELYAVFPFRLVSFEKDNAELGRQAFEHRWDRGNFGWRQEELFLAYLGLAEGARSNLVKRARNSHQGSRFPAFWGPNYDWIPDQDHGGVLMKAVQAMLLQTDGDVIHLLPAWPRDWDVSFRLHAPRRTVIECEVRGGEILSLRVTPEERARDVVISDAWDG
jgi:hypothetical protein